ncbi:arginine--tRNA ligase [Candidatus Marinamargulisbacteria bacterium SCGC AG-439-L15]|nr:arginine--tRNA ligase [Candidatus Marinamargulisbacteria bacterium SCGC AG-439-L15]
MIKYEIKDRLQSCLKKNNYPETERLFLDRPKQANHGDFSTNYALMLSKTLKKNPKEIAEDISNLINTDSNLSKDLSVTPLNGFINIQLQDTYLEACLKEVLDQKSPFPNTQERILLEFISANPTGPLHIGHGRWAVIGDVLSRILKRIGITVSTEFYINDAGNQIQLFYDSIEAVRQGNPVPESGYHGAYVHDLAKSDQDAIEAVLDQQKRVLDMLDVTVDNWFSEKTLHEAGAVSEVLSFLEEKGVVYKKEDAIWFKTTDFGDDKDRVLVKSDGAYTYFAVDVAYHYTKIKRNYDQLITILGADHHGYVHRLNAAVTALSDKEAQINDFFHVLIGQLVNLFRAGEPVRMSKRTGEMITLEEVVNEIGADAVRFFLIQKSMDTHIDFDLELAKQKSSDNPVYYVQYAHARISSVFRKLPYNGDLPTALSFDPKERALVFHLIRFNAEVYDAAMAFQPYRVAQYLLDMARLFHGFYEHCPILKASPEDQQRRLFILHQTKRVFQEGLSLLGVTAPEQM